MIMTLITDHWQNKSNNNESCKNNNNNKSWHEEKCNQVPKRNEHYMQKLKGTIKKIKQNKTKWKAKTPSMDHYSRNGLIGDIGPCSSFNKSHE